MTLDLAGLADRIAVEERLLMYVHLLDSWQFERIAAEIFTPDASVDFAGDHVVGRTAIHAQVMGYRGALKGCSHNITNIFIEIAGDEARASCRVVAWHWFGIPGADTLAPSDLLAVGGYQDRLRRTVDGWRIYERRGLSYGTGIGVGTVPEAMRPMIERMAGRKADWPA